MEVQNWRWADVPFYLRTGKRLARRATEIAIQFKLPPLMLFGESATPPEPNLLALRIQPDEGIMLRFAAKVPELGLDVRSVNMDFTYGSSFARDAPEAYETLLLDAMLGDASLFTRADEVEAAWGIVTPIIEHVARVGRGRRARQRHLLLRGGPLGSRERRRADRARRPPLAAAVGDMTARRKPSHSASTPIQLRRNPYSRGRPDAVATADPGMDPTDVALARAREQHRAVRREAGRGLDEAAEQAERQQADQRSA